MFKRVSKPPSSLWLLWNQLLSLQLLLIAWLRRTTTLRPQLFHLDLPTEWIWLCKMEISQMPVKGWIWQFKLPPARMNSDPTPLRTRSRNSLPSHWIAQSHPNTSLRKLQVPQARLIPSWPMLLWNSLSLCQLKCRTSFPRFKDPSSCLPRKNRTNLTKNSRPSATSRLSRFLRPPTLVMISWTSQWHSPPKPCWLRCKSSMRTFWRTQS